MLKSIQVCPKEKVLWSKAGCFSRAPQPCRTENKYAQSFFVCSVPCIVVSRGIGSDAASRSARDDRAGCSEGRSPSAVVARQGGRDSAAAQSFDNRGQIRRGRSASSTADRVAQTKSNSHVCR